MASVDNIAITNKSTSLSSVGIIYILRHKTNGKVYVGQTWQGLAKRLRQHRAEARRGKSHMLIGKAIRKHGLDVFETDILCVCSSQAELDAQELYYARAFNAFSPYGYNIRAGQGVGSLADEAKAALSRINKGRIVSQATRDKISLALRGHPVSEGTRRKMSARHKGKCSPEQLARLTQKGAKRSELSRQKQSATLQGHVVEGSTRAKIAIRHRLNGHKPTASAGAKARRHAVLSVMRPFYLVSPAGEEILVFNLAAFARHRGLQVDLLRQVVRGKRPHHQGWRRDIARYNALS